MSEGKIVQEECKEKTGKKVQFESEIYISNAMVMKERTNKEMNERKVCIRSLINNCLV